MVRKKLFYKATQITKCQKIFVEEGSVAQLSSSQLNEKEHVQTNMK